MLYLGTRKSAHSHSTQRALEAADGYLYFGMLDEAVEELDSVSVPEKSLPIVTLARVRILLHQRKWKEAEELSNSGAVSHPDEEEFTVQRAFALHQLNKGAQAIEVLLAAPEWIRRTGILHYNLGCYEARLGDVSTAKQCIRAAIQINSAMTKSAKVDPDLKEVWN